MPRDVQARATDAAAPVRERAYEAVRQVIRQLPPMSRDDVGEAAENGRVWRAVYAALDAYEPILRAAIAEEIAQAIQKIHDRLAASNFWENEGRAYLQTAIAAAREAASTDDPAEEA